MHTMILHPNFPSQFGNLAMTLANRPNDKVTFVTSTMPSQGQLPFDVISYSVNGQPIPTMFHGGRTIESLLQHAEAALRCVQPLDLKPDVVVGHASYGTWLYLRAIYPNARFIAYHEIIPPPYWSEEFSLRRDFPPTVEARCFNASYHMLAYMLLHYCDAAYTPTRYQLSTAPVELRHKIRVIHDGVDCDLFKRQQIDKPHVFHNVRIEHRHKVVTYLARGLESFRGFDVFMKAAKVMCEVDPDVICIVVGGERTVYGHDDNYTEGKSFKQWILDQDDYPLDRIHFLGLIPPSDLVEFYSISDVHIYLTVPWVLSWSLVQAMACGCCVVVSDTEPLRDVVTDCHNGVYCNMMDHRDVAAAALLHLRMPISSRCLGDKAAATIKAKFSTATCIPEIIKLLEG